MTTKVAINGFGRIGRLTLGAVTRVWKSFFNLSNT